MSYPNADISFPGLFGDWRFTLSPKLLDIGNGIYWYGVLIAAGAAHRSVVLHEARAALRSERGRCA